ncbi:hypothetical protein AAES_11717 [Amazona aestiva]|uniref:Uncharacterized protein n=1 Tax=Amazona aestiva TaxID=12930 RepID=A0A0Q3U2F8_AMAAE|nr:hypothetical protein AAES_11717 [Amazona aestiva]
MKVILLPRTLLIPRKSLLLDHLKPAGGNVLMAHNNAETSEHINEEPEHFHQTVVAAPEVLTPDNSDADLDSSFDLRPVDPEKKPDLDPPDPHDKWAVIKGKMCIDTVGHFSRCRLATCIGMSVHFGQHKSPSLM